jgi:hypothetical protein
MRLMQCRITPLHNSRATGPNTNSSRGEHEVHAGVDREWSNLLVGCFLPFEPRESDCDSR